MKVLDLLKGRKIKVMTDAKVEVELEVKTVEETPHSRELEPPSRSNDFWPPTETWTTIKVTFTNGFVKEYQNLSAIDLVDE